MKTFFRLTLIMLANILSWHSLILKTAIDPQYRVMPELKRAVRRKLLYMHDAAERVNLRGPPGNGLQAL